MNGSEFIRVLETGLRDPIEHFRLRLLRTLIDLLEAQPLHEQSMLLSVLANKVASLNLSNFKY